MKAALRWFNLRFAFCFRLFRVLCFFLGCCWSERKAGSAWRGKRVQFGAKQRRNSRERQAVFAGASVTLLQFAACKLNAANWQRRYLRMRRQMHSILFNLLQTTKTKRAEIEFCARQSQAELLAWLARFSRSNIAWSAREKQLIALMKPRLREIKPICALWTSI